ncbi:hypothetical protein HOC37_00650 [bacterium]|jgi:hypothetical protein|nr:hypothetical protein [bacterium]MBT3581561.1 hypothetical protein [bacterium]MBT4551474.1 hypothetical protein [bacterium]MBT5988884.1 hypothetical protein [bacterium]MBT7088396.1 hypothetical protein [bacterium]
MGLKKIVAVTLSDAEARANREANVTSAIETIQRVEQPGEDESHIATKTELTDFSPCEQAMNSLKSLKAPRAIPCLIEVLNASKYTPLDKANAMEVLRTYEGTKCFSGEYEAYKEEFHRILISIVSDDKDTLKQTAANILEWVATREDCLPALRREILRVVPSDTKNAIREYVTPNPNLYKLVCRYAKDIKAGKILEETAADRLSQIEKDLKEVQVDFWHEEEILVLGVSTGRYKDPKTLLQKAAKGGLPKLIDLLKNKGATVDLVSPPPLRRTALAYALAERQKLVKKGQPAQRQIEAAVALIGLGADIKLVSQEIEIPPDILHQAARLGNAVAIDYLIAGGATPMAIDGGVTPLYDAINYGKEHKGEADNWSAAKALFGHEQALFRRSLLANPVSIYDPLQHETYFSGSLSSEELSLRETFKEYFVIPG